MEFLIVYQQVDWQELHEHHIALGRGMWWALRTTASAHPSHYITTPGPFKQTSAERKKDVLGSNTFIIYKQNYTCQSMGWKSIDQI